jgi:hypothetical protein
MSHITDVILLCGNIGEVNFQDRLNQICVFGTFLVSVDDGKLPKDWYGGPKRLQCCIAIGAMNHLDIPEFLNFLRTKVKWDRKFDEFCQVILQNERENGFTLYDIFREPPNI